MNWWYLRRQFHCVRVISWWFGFPDQNRFKIGGFPDDVLCLGIQACKQGVDQSHYENHTLLIPTEWLKIFNTVLHILIHQKHNDPNCAQIHHFIRFTWWCGWALIRVEKKVPTHVVLRTDCSSSTLLCDHSKCATHRADHSFSPLTLRIANLSEILSLVCNSRPQES